MTIMTGVKLIYCFSASNDPGMLLAGLGESSPKHCLNDAGVDEVSLAAFHPAQDVVHLLGGPEAVVVHPLALAASPLTGSAMLLFLDFCVNFHDDDDFKLVKLFIFAMKNPRWGGFSLPFGNQKPISNFILIFQILKEIASFIELWVFHFSYSFQGFRIPLLQSLIDYITKIAISFELRKQNQDYFFLKIIFFSAFLFI